MVFCAEIRITSEFALAVGKDDRSATAMSDKVRAWVWDLDLPPARKLVLLWLAGRATDNGVAFPGEREIRDRTGLGERMVRYHLQGLTADELDRPDTNPGPLLRRIERPLRACRVGRDGKSPPRPPVRTRRAGFPHRAPQNRSVARCLGR